MAAGDVVFGGLIGLGVDVASGAMNKYPDIVTVPMTPDPACAGQPCRGERAKQRHPLLRPPDSSPTIARRYFRFSSQYFNAASASPARGV
jgi:hypothetical protein